MQRHHITYHPGEFAVTTWACFDPRCACERDHAWVMDDVEWEKKIDILSRVFHDGTDMPAYAHRMAISQLKQHWPSLHAAIVGVVGPF